MLLLRITLFLLMSATAFPQTFSTRGTEFWTGFMESSVGIGYPASRVGFFIGARRTTTGVITVPSTGYSYPFTVDAGTVTTILLPRATFTAAGSDRVEKKGIVIRSDDSIEVYALHYRNSHSDASMVLPVGQLGSRYVAIAAHDSFGTSASSLLVVAGEDDTELEITPSATTRGARPASVPYTVTLDRGESYQIQAEENLSGTLVQSTNRKRFALYGGAQSTFIECHGDNHVYDQLLPLEQWGLEYLVTPFSGRRDQLKIVASEDSTDVLFDCTRTIRLDKGDVYTWDFTLPVRITATRPIGIAQFSRGFQCGRVDGGLPYGDPTMLVLTPISQRLRYAAFHAPANLLPSSPDFPGFDTHYLTLVVPLSDTADLRLDGVQISARLQPHPADPRYLQASIPISAGNHLLEAPNGVHAYAYGFSYVDGYSYSLGADTLKFEPGSRLAFAYTAGAYSLAIAPCDTLPGGLKLCAGGPFTFRVDDDTTTGEWQWDFGDGTRGIGSQIVHTFDSAGEYDVVLTSPGPGCTSRMARRRVVVGACKPRDAASQLEVLPNPTKRSVEVRSIVRRRSIVTLELLGAQGELLGVLSQQMLDPGIHVTSVDMGDHPSGVYYLRGSFGDEVIVAKIIRME